MYSQWYLINFKKLFYKYTNLYEDLQISHSNKDNNKVRNPDQMGRVRSYVTENAVALNQVCLSYMLFSI